MILEQGGIWYKKYSKTYGKDGALNILHKSPQEANGKNRKANANLPPGRWAMGRVIELHPGADGFVRVVSLKTKGCIIKWPVVKLSILPVETQDSIAPPSDNLENEVNTATFKNERNNINISINTKRFGNFLTLALYFFYFMSILAVSRSAYNITALKAKQGLYLDKTSNMQLVRDHWKIVIYYDMDPYWQGIEAFKQYIKYLDTLCTNIKSKTHCDTSVMQLRHSFSELDYYDQLLLSQHAATRPERRRRGLIDGVGYIANSLFGVLDERFAEQYKKDITLLSKNQQHLANLWRNQTSVIEAEYNLLKRSEQQIDKLRKTINRHFMDIEKVINSQTTEINNLEQSGVGSREPWRLRRRRWRHATHQQQHPIKMRHDRQCPSKTTVISVKV